MLKRREFLLGFASSALMLEQADAQFYGCSIGYCFGSVPAYAVVPGGWPNASNTGPRVATSPFSGNITTTSNGQVISGLDITGQVIIAHDNVLVVDCKIHGSLYGVDSRTNAKVATVQYCEIYGCFTGVFGTNTVERCNIHDMENGISGGAGTGAVRYNYMHDFLYTGTPHYDGVELNGLQSNWTILGNNIINLQGQTSCLNINNFDGSSSNIVVDSNRLEGGSYCVYFDGQFAGGGVLSGMSAVNNTMVPGGFGFFAVNANTPLLQGNIRESTGAYLAGQTFYAPGSALMTPSAALSGQDTNTNISFRAVCVMGVASSGSVRLVYQAPPANPLQASHVSIGKQTSAGSTTATPIEVTFNGGQHGFSLQAGEYIASDLINHSGSFTLGIGDSAVCIVDLPNVAGMGQTFGTGNSNVTTYFKTADQSWNVANIAALGYSLSSGNNFSLIGIRS